MVIWRRESFRKFRNERHVTASMAMKNRERFKQICWKKIHLISFLRTNLILKLYATYFEVLRRVVNEKVKTHFSRKLLKFKLLSEKFPFMIRSTIVLKFHLHNDCLKFVQFYPCCFIERWVSGSYGKNSRNPNSLSSNHNVPSSTKRRKMKKKNRAASFKKKFQSSRPRWIYEENFRYFRARLNFREKRVFNFPAAALCKLTHRKKQTHDCQSRGFML